ncbi:flagella synthesis protein FlgN [Vibrio sp.]|uniref:flagella synthesis protein FlgN n=1 Tax=Vibrio sp. TaxID=678 RepID=UPI003D0C03B4
MASLQSLIDFQLDNAKAFSTLLEKEKLAITSRVSKQIEALAKEKLTLINQLQQADQRISQHPDVELLQSVDELKQKVEQVRTIIADCQRMNLVNGEALKRAQLSFNKLNNLMQQSQNKAGMTYTADGKAQNISTLGTNLKA